MKKEEPKIQECKKCDYTFSSYYYTDLCNSCYNAKSKEELKPQPKLNDKLSITRSILVTEEGQNWSEINNNYDAEIWQLTEKGYQDLLVSYKTDMIEDEDILNVVDIGDEEVRTLFKSNSTTVEEAFNE